MARPAREGSQVARRRLAPPAAIMLRLLLVIASTIAPASAGFGRGRAGGLSGGSVFSTSRPATGVPAGGTVTGVPVG
jgi:hypothetical protein